VVFTNYSLAHCSLLLVAAFLPLLLLHNFWLFFFARFTQNSPSYAPLLFAPLRSCSVADADEVVGELLDGVGGHAGLDGLRVVSDKDGHVGLDDHDAFSAL
jgi:hypothetical protein